jgi:hypothetical protein
VQLRGQVAQCGGRHISSREPLWSFRIGHGEALTP